VPTTSSGAPAAHSSGTFPRLTPAVDLDRHPVGKQAAQGPDAVERVGHERLAGITGVDAHPEDEVHRSGYDGLRRRLGIEREANGDSESAGGG
jgi:hypothetical protein